MQVAVLPRGLCTCRSRELDIRIIAEDSGQLIRELTLDPTRDYQSQTPKV